jgi:hypothetical protein
VFLWGILRKRVFLWWFFDGENVVECVVNVVFWQSLFWGGKMGQVFEIYFLGLPVLGMSGVWEIGGMGARGFVSGLEVEGWATRPDGWVRCGSCLRTNAHISESRYGAPGCLGFGDGCDGDFHAGDANR